MAPFPGDAEIQIQGDLPLCAAFSPWEKWGLLGDLVMDCTEVAPVVRTGAGGW